MGLFSDRLPRGLARGAHGLRGLALTATSDARVVAVVLLLAAVALAYEMALSFK